LQQSEAFGLNRKRVCKFHFLRAFRRSSVYRRIASFFGKFNPQANFEEDKDESQSTQPCGNKYQRRLAGTQVAKELTDCAHDEFAVWQHSVDSMAHSPGNKRQGCSGDCGSKQPAKCTQEFLASHHHSVNSTPKSDCNRNRRHCSVPLLINERPRRLAESDWWNGLRVRLLLLLS
jgi:hypothetical protein